jgi:hypothetical protein
VSLFKHELANCRSTHFANIGPMSALTRHALNTKRPGVPHDFATVTSNATRIGMNINVRSWNCISFS